MPSAVSLAFPRADQASMWTESSANNFGALGMYGPHGGGALNRWRTNDSVQVGNRGSSRAVFTCAKILCAFPSANACHRAEPPGSSSLVLKRKLLRFRAANTFCF